ncbi:MAG: YjbQ family protein, partial [Halieaceae bacterium]|nr:YjbQ family protein [Halieaceae bacterium]
MIEQLDIRISGQGLHPFTPVVSELVKSSGLDEGLCSLFIRHTSASLLIQENY